MAAQPCHPSLTSLRRAESALYRDLRATFDTMQRLDAAHCADEVYLAVAREYRRLSEAHIAACRKLERRYDERLVTRYEAEALGAAMQADRADYLWESSVAD